MALRLSPDAPEILPLIAVHCFITPYHIRHHFHSPPSPTVQPHRQYIYSPHLRRYCGFLPPAMSIHILYPLSRSDPTLFFPDKRSWALSPTSSGITWLHRTSALYRWWRYDTKTRTDADGLPQFKTRPSAGSTPLSFSPHNNQRPEFLSLGRHLHRHRAHPTDSFLLHNFSQWRYHLSSKTGARTSSPIRSWMQSIQIYDSYYATSTPMYKSSETQDQDGVQTIYQINHPVFNLYR